MKQYKDFYGCRATTTKNGDGYKLIIRTAQGKRFYSKVLKSERACKQVMSRFSDSTMHEIHS